MRAYNKIMWKVNKNLQIHGDNVCTKSIYKTMILFSIVLQIFFFTVSILKKMQQYSKNKTNPEDEISSLDLL